MSTKRQKRDARRARRDSVGTVRKAETHAARVRNLERTLSKERVALVLIGDAMDDPMHALAAARALAALDGKPLRAFVKQAQDRVARGVVTTEWLRVCGEAVRGHVERSEAAAREDAACAGGR